MVKIIVLFALVTGLVLAHKTEYDGVNTIKALRSLVETLDNNAFATCELVLFSTPMNYADASKKCKNFRIGAKNEMGSLVTIDSKEKAGNLLFLYDTAVPQLGRPQTDRFNRVNWIWTGLQKVNNTDVKGKNKKEVRKYDPNEWVWQGTGKSPIEYSNWPTKKKNGQPDQSYLKKNKNGCPTRGGCYQNQVRFDGSMTWDDGWDFEEHLYACDYKGKYILSNQHKTWERAKEACSKAGLHLAMVRSKREVEEMKEAINYFLGPGNDDWHTFDPQNWVWLGGHDINNEGVFEWLNGKPVNTWDVPWRVKAGKDNASFIKKAGTQNVVAFSRSGEFDDSYQHTKKKQRPFACQCPGS